MSKKLVFHILLIKKLMNSLFGVYPKQLEEQEAIKLNSKLNSIISILIMQMMSLIVKLFYLTGMLQPLKLLMLLTIV